ncbi:GNAT family N-acetyltransferase [Brachybacterium tyrofermentans]|uniref:GNAT family N-acetyltransferase n=1 Tax=Brachybacterium tyrofermentans TaxID=47848 RepID=UPI00299F910E|nr:GNAT family N-acetyltransferase [Brachybacterium tyrofermentans]
MAGSRRILLTERLSLSPPDVEDVDALHRICADPRVWTHYPSLRHTERAQTEQLIDGWQRSWEETGLGTWTIRLRETGESIGYGGCSLLHGCVWNLGYRIDADHHGHGYATELALTARTAAEQVPPQRPVIAHLLEHNHASAAVARKSGLTLVDRGPDVGNPDPNAIRLIYSNTALTADQLDAARR